MIDHIPSKQDILDASNRIKKFIHNTPVLTSSSINSILGGQLFFKCENFQKVGAFKFRGASNVVLSLTDEEIKRGVITHSSGNHAAALSLAAKLRGARRYIVMPRTAPRIKKKAVEDYGGEITFCEPTLPSREKTANIIIEKTKAVLVHPYDNYTIIAGAATAAKELIEEIDHLDYIIAPVGGGGLLSGTSLSAHYFSNNIKVIGAEPKGADDAFRSIRDNKIYPSVNPKTIADGLLTSLSQRTFSIIKDNVEEIITVEEETIISAMRVVWERMKIIIEPSAAAALAAVFEKKKKLTGKRIGVIFSGGNVDLEKLPW